MEPAYRSGFERAVAADLRKKRVAFEYETLTVPLDIPVSTRYTCSDCKSHRIQKRSYYTPDFFPLKEVIIECKGKFTPADRKKVLAYQNQHGQLHLLFMRNNRLSKGSKTTYGEWADRNEFPWAIGPSIPKDWT